jgi:hypothetical protein
MTQNEFARRIGITQSHIFWQCRNGFGMRNRLFIFGSLPHDPQSILAAICGLALVGIKCSPYLHLRFVPRCFDGLELRITAFTYAKDGHTDAVYETQFPLRHNQSLAHQLKEAYAYGN